MMRQAAGADRSVVDLHAPRFNQKKMYEGRVMKNFFVLFMVTVLCLFSSSSYGRENPVKIIFDSDMALDPEDMNALCLLHAFADEGEAEIIATVACGYETNRASGATIDAINTFYHRPENNIWESLQR